MVVCLDLALTFVPCTVWIGLTLTPGATMPDRATRWPFVFWASFIARLHARRLQSSRAANMTTYYVPSALNRPADPGPGSWKTPFPGKPNFCRPLVAPSVAVVHAVFCHFTIAPRTARSCRQTWCSGPDGLY
ncbi:hypothetical protein COCSADRAFT_38354 [Bipolaris sorokiniana ND90Pr]|uniref:Secreted protein n=1 Tax=Cochliobolus sativus (strain ND90Pr / ATCC 201652) TaxID=665912 RepID=M2T056_COCSN|nr:uncharacterized protein COCSADRAFT_38354 [Bipolaris sorokiniana ND90Pr]EMD62412.1 hypothetical protein COCSADRAFT_38354 [Bipolaris sorokiniana ND90Pr]